MRDNSQPMSEPSPQRTGFTRARVAAGLGLLIPLIPIVIGLSLGGSGSFVTAGASSFVPVPFPPLSSLHPLVPPMPPLSTLHPLVPPGNGTLIAVVAHPATMRSSPGGHVLTRMQARTQFGSRQVLWVARLSGPWLGVISPLAGNNRLGWIRASDASLSRVNWELKVSLRARRLTVVHDGHPVANYVIAIGRATAPTPTGRFAVTDRLNTGDPTGPYGCCILALSADAPHAIQGWSGGNRIAIHSTPDTSTIGDAISHGCIHVTLAQGQWLLDHIPLGTPTLVTG
jgi:hypothetical protein